MQRWVAPILMFVSTLIVELMMMVAFDLFPLPAVQGQAGALVDACVLGAAIFILYVGAARRLARSAQRAVGNGLVLAVVAVAFEWQLHLTGQQFVVALGTVGAHLVDAVLTASVVAGVAAWLGAVDERLETLGQPSIPLYRALGRQIVVGAAICAACIAAVPLLAGANASHRNVSSRTAWALVDALGRERALSQHVGRLALTNPEQSSSVYAEAVARAGKQELVLKQAWSAYASRHRITTEEARYRPETFGMTASRNGYLSLARAFAASPAKERAALQIDLQGAVDEYAGRAEAASDVVAATENWRTSLHDDDLIAWLGPIVLFLLAAGMLWPLLRLVAAQQSQLSQAFNQARDMALRDPLTGLGNRRFLMDELERWCAEPGSRFAALLIDLDRFKPINDQYGHPVGDRVLEIVGERLGRIIRADCIVARMGGDEFTILCRYDGDADALRAMARRIIEALGEPLSVSGLSLSIGASIGVALYPKDAKTGQDLLRFADVALYRAKVRRGETWFFDSGVANDVAPVVNKMMAREGARRGHAGE